MQFPQKSMSMKQLSVCPDIDFVFCWGFFFSQHVVSSFSFTYYLPLTSGPPQLTLPPCVYLTLEQPVLNTKPHSQTEMFMSTSTPAWMPRATSSLINVYTDGYHNRLWGILFHFQLEIGDASDCLSGQVGASVCIHDFLGCLEGIWLLIINQNPKR